MTKFKSILGTQLYRNGKRDDAMCQKTEQMKTRLIQKGARVIHHWNGHIEYLHKGFVWVFDYVGHWETGVPCCYVGVKLA